MRRPKTQPKDTRLPRLHDATPTRRTDGPAHDHTSPKLPTPRVTRGTNFRLRNVKRD